MTYPIAVYSAVGPEDWAMFKPGYTASETLSWCCTTWGGEGTWAVFGVLDIEQVESGQERGENGRRSNV